MAKRRERERARERGLRFTLQWRKEKEKGRDVFSAGPPLAAINEVIKFGMKAPSP